MEIRDSESFNPEFELLVMACVVRSTAFYAKFGSLLNPEMFVGIHPRMILLYIAEYYKSYKVVPSHTVLVDLIQKGDFEDRGSLVKYLQDLPEATDEGYVAQQVINWCKSRAIELVLSDPENRKDVRGFAKQIDNATRIGDGLLQTHTTLADDRDGELVSGDPMPTPWDWLSERMNGGPVKGDFGVVMSIINGGKTTNLVNWAMNWVARGYNGVYFTAEDGEAKIKRRMLQWINGWDTPTLLDRIAEGRARRDRFLQASGGFVHIADFKSRRTTVEDAMAAVRTIEEANDRPVDFVITDYADKFRATGRYNEPRHALREIYEDCKFLARELDVVHVTASQTAVRMTQGKDVIGLEAGSESTSKFESAEFVLGFGQTLEDERRGTITMNIAKMRDAKKHDMTSLIADFSRQRIYELGDASMRPKK